MGGGTPSKQRVIEKNFFYFFIVTQIRSDETPRIFNFKKKKFCENLPNSRKFWGPTQNGRLQGSQRCNFKKFQNR